MQIYDTEEIMKNASLKRTIYFEETESGDLIINSQAACCNWNMKGKLRINTNDLKRALGVDDIQNVKIKILSNAEECDSNLRLYVYITKKCNTSVLNAGETSHALQVSLGNNKRKNWVSAESDFSAKVFIDDENKLIMLIEDVVLDIQMFYFYHYEKQYDNYLERREFSKKKVLFLTDRGESSYLGEVKDTEYISFASFCRDGENFEINYDKYLSMWEDFHHRENANKLSEKDIIGVDNLLLSHPKYGQLSIAKIEKILNKLPYGEYLLVRTEKRPKKQRYSQVIKSRFGMKKWKNGRVKIVPAKYYFTYHKMIPYVSIYEIHWKGGGNK